ncbi:MAG: LCP family protein [Thermincolia bacterium]
MRIKILLKIILLFSFVFAATFGTGYFAVNWLQDDPFDKEVTYGDGSGKTETGKINILLLGLDARPGEKNTRTDTMIVASIDRDAKKVALLSIPRDTMVEIPGYRKTKINNANEYGGPELAAETVEKILDTKMDFWVKTNFDGFRDIIDTLGGVTIDVEKRMVYRDPTDGTNINLYPGVQRLDGKKALDYVRFRHEALGDISRTQRQQNFLKALTKEMLQPSTVLKLPKLVPDVMAAVETNLSTKQMLALAKFSTQMDGGMEIASQTLPGQFYNNRGSYWKYNEEKAKVVLNDLNQGVVSETVAGPDINVAKEKKKKITKKDVATFTTKPAGQTQTGERSTEKMPEHQTEDISQDNGSIAPETGNNQGTGNGQAGIDPGNGLPPAIQPGTGTTPNPGAQPGTGTTGGNNGGGNTQQPTTPPTITPTEPPATNPNPVSEPNVNGRNTNTTASVVGGTI